MVSIAILISIPFVVGFIFDFIVEALETTKSQPTSETSMEEDSRARLVPMDQRRPGSNRFAVKAHLHDDLNPCSDKPPARVN